jgi:hypothetical protein
VFGFEKRVNGLRGIRYPMKPTFPPRIYPSKEAINKFLREWAQVGIVEALPGPGGPLPDEVWVETGRQIERDPPAMTALDETWGHVRGQSPTGRGPHPACRGFRRSWRSSPVP